MALFESLVLLLFVSALLMAAARRLAIPYPTLLSMAGIGFALLPMAPDFGIDPHLALAAFIAPALLDAAFDTSPRELTRLWAPLLALAVGAVVVTTGVVALIGWHFTGLPVAAAIALGAIVAPPDAVAAKAVMNQVGMPRRSSLVLQGESLLNDATALLLFGGAVAAAAGDLDDGGAVKIALAIPGGILLGLAAGLLAQRLRPLFEGTHAAIIIEFTMTFGTWLIAERLHLSPVLAVVSCAMLLSTRAPDTQSARDRIQSYAVWAAVVFVLNVLAFLLMGLQVRSIVTQLGPRLSQAMLLALGVLVAVITVRLVVVLGYRLIAGWIGAAFKPAWLARPRPWRFSILIGWSGMRGLLTLATAFALPAAFPGRSEIVLCAFTVVIGTLVIQGMTVRPLMKLLRIQDDDSFAEDLARARARMMAVGLEAAAGETGEAAAILRAKLSASHAIASTEEDPQEATGHDRAMARVIAAQRASINAGRKRGEIPDDAFQALQEELDWLEMAARPNRELEVRET